MSLPAVAETSPPGDRLTSGRHHTSVRRAALVCAMVACINAVVWSFITPPFQVPDEPSHFAFVKQLAETGQLPVSVSAEFSAEELAAMSGLNYYGIARQPQNHTISSPAEQRALEKGIAQAARSSPPGSPAAGVATAQPPLFYALQTIPYRLAPGSLLDRLALMRMLSALMGGLTALFVFLFVREALPGVPWAWTVGGLASALTPLAGFMSGSVNPDAMLFTTSAALFYALARAFRRGLTKTSAAAIGAAAAIGFMTKLNFLGLAPGAFLGLIVLSMRAARISRSSAFGALAIALMIGASPLLVYGIIDLSSGDLGSRFLSENVAGRSGHGSTLGDISYIWQFYLPRLPGMTNDFPGIFTLRQIWFNGFIGQYGWIDTVFPGWVYTLALVPAGLILLLGGRALVGGRETLRRRSIELLVYTCMSAGVLVIVGAGSYTAFPEVDGSFQEARYLLPMLPLLGAIYALAARGAGRRWGPTLGMSIVLLALAHDVLSQLLVVARYYG
jgi:4-amino-4-deoxy-L-arabinose transferase-like glycosyltransferase